MFASLTSRFGGKLNPPLEGLAYRFTVFLPVLSEGKTVFSDRQRALLNYVFRDCCGGYSQSSLESHPPWLGSWLPETGEAPITDHHILLVVYTLQNEEASKFFRQLKWALQLEHVAEQQVVLIEQVPVRLVEAEEID